MSAMVTADEFRQALAQLASGVTVVATTDPSGAPFGLTVTAFCSVSLVPPQVLVSIDRHAEAHPVIAASRVFAVSLLADTQSRVSRAFAVPGAAKWSEVPTTRGPHTGAPLVAGAVASLECTVTHALDALEASRIERIVILGRQQGDRLLRLARLHRAQRRIKRHGAFPCQRPAATSVTTAGSRNRGIF